MRILHLADIHFGAKYLEDLREPVELIVNYVAEIKPDLVAIAGDLTVDRGVVDNASALACRTMIARIADLARVAILPGNHDITHRADQPDNVSAILSDAIGSVIDRVDVHTAPGVTVYDDVALAVIPYPSTALFQANTGETSLESLNERLAQLSIGLAAEAIATGKVPLMMFHGTIEGGRHGDERSPAMLTRGTDVVLPVAALAGFRGVLAGHLHHPQELQLPDGVAVYPGCVAPLTFGERTIEPGVELWTIDNDSRTISRERLPLPVTHQRIQVDVSGDDWDTGADATLNLKRWIGGAGADLEGARIKLAITASKQRLELITGELCESVREQMALHELRIEKTPIPETRAILGDDADRAARVDIPDALTIYAEQCDDPEFSAHLEQVQEIAREVEGLVEAQDRDPRYSFEPRSLHVEHYKSIEVADIDFDDLPDRVGVFGPTGIGKSNLILAMFWLLYGSNPKSEDGKARTSLGEIVQRGEKKAKGSLRFACREGEFEITREVARSKNGQGKGTLFLSRIVDGAEEPISEGTARETQQRINDLVGPPELYWLIRHLRQHGESAIKMGAAKLADSINSTLQLDFEARAELAKSMRDDAAAARNTAGTRADTLLEQLPLKGALDENERRWEQELSVARATKETQTASLADLEAKQEEVQTELATVEAKAAEAERLRQKRAAVQGDVEKASVTLEQLRNRLLMIPQTPAMPELVAEEQKKRKQLDDARDRLHILREAHTAQLTEEASKLGALQQAERAALSALRDAEAKLAGCRSGVEDAAKTAALLDEVPCEGGEWSRDGESRQMAACRLLVNATQARESLPELTDLVADAEEWLRATQSVYERDNLKVAQFQGEAEKARDDRAAQMRDLEAEVADCQKAHAMASSLLADLRTAAEQRAELEQRIAELEPRAGLLEEQLAEIDRRLEGCEEVVDRAKVLREAVSEARVAVSNRRAKLAELETTIASAISGLDRVREQRQSRAQMLLQIEDLRAEEAKHDHKRMAAAYYLQSVQRNGIPSLLLERLAPILEQRVNEILMPSGRRVRIETVRVTTTGQARPEVNLQFQSPTSGGEWIPIAELSGGEEDIANAAWAVGLARTAAEMSGSTLGLLVLDEPFTGVSAEYDEAIRDVLGTIQTHVNRVCLITHKADLKPMVEAALQLSQNGSGAVLEVQK